MQWWCAGTGVPWDWDWQWYPGVHIMMLLLAFAWWRTGKVQEWSRRPWLPFLTGWFLLLLTLDWPLGKLAAGYLASAHTAQFILLTMLITPALLYAVPAEGWARMAARGNFGSWLLRMNPWIYLMVFNVIVVVTHIPTVVDGGMREQWGSFAIDLSWFVAGLMLWWPVVAPARQRRLGNAATLLYLFFATIVPTIPAMMMVFAEWPLFSLYELAPRFSVHFTANEDLQLAGLSMKLIGDLPLWFAAGAVFFTRMSNENVTNQS